MMSDKISFSDDCIYIYMYTHKQIDVYANTYMCVIKTLIYNRRVSACE